MHDLIYLLQNCTNCFVPTELAISPEVLTNSWLSILSDIPSEREASVNISLMKDWRFLPQIPSFSVSYG